MEILRTHVYGFQMALEGMRNPKESWHLSDSKFGPVEATDGEMVLPWETIGMSCPEAPRIGPADLKLATKLIRGGSEHRKFLRQIMVWVTWVLPRYVHTECDTYKVATVRNSCSTMHKLGHRDLTPEDFAGGIVVPQALMELNILGKQYRSEKNYEAVRMMKRLLPEGFLQRATMTFSYETLLAMHSQRKNHRLPEWSGEGGICEWIRSLPYMAKFIEASEQIK